MYFVLKRLYWSDWAGEIRSFDKSMQFSLPDVIASGIKKPYELEVYDGTIVTKGISVHFADDFSLGL